MNPVRILLRIAAPIFVGMIMLLASASNDMVIAERLAARCGFTQIGHDDQGRVTGLMLSSRRAYLEPAPWLGEQVREIDHTARTDLPQLTDADLPLLFELPHLRFLRFDSQMITGAGYWSLKGLARLEFLGLHAIDRRELDPASYDPTCILVANELPLLRRFDYKHNFRLRGVPVAQLRGSERFAYLHLDNACAESSIVPVLLASPNLTRLDLHRTGITREDLARIVTGLPRLTDLRLRPLDEQGLQPADLALLVDLPALAALSFGGAYNRMAFDFEHDLAHLLTIPTLRSITAPVRKQEDPAFMRLVEALPTGVVTFAYH